MQENRRVQATSNLVFILTTKQIVVLSTTHHRKYDLWEISLRYPSLQLPMLKVEKMVIRVVGQALAQEFPTLHYCLHLKGDG